MSIRNNILRRLEIAAVESLFSPMAFTTSRARILSTDEIEAQSQVDLDPIVLFKTLHGYLVITAWGDEANDELIFKPANN